MTVTRGSCLCGGIKFEIDGPLMSPMNCYCSQCRKQHGAAFRSRVRVQSKDFRWLQGEDLIKYHESPRGYLRGFCRECGSPIINRTGPNWKAPAEFPDPPSPQYGIALAILDDPHVRPACHVFVGSKPPWFDITDDLPQYAAYPPPG
jgi:hypothetical protein